MDSFKPGQIWLDTNGNRIQAHGGSILYENGTFYWYGENKEKTKPDNDIWHWGVKCYASKDLYNWEDKGIIIPPEPDNPGSPLHPVASMDRPHIIYNKRSEKYVCWLKIMDDIHSQSETVLVADSLLGPYTKVRQGLKPLGMNAGDFDLVVAPDGKAYYYFERVHTELICADLTDDYTDVVGYYSTHFPLVAPPFVREAPAYFFRNGKHYLFTSGTTGYFPNPSEVAMADTFHGPWEVLGNPHRNDSSKTSFNSQITSVFKHPGKKDLYIALADRWIPALPQMAPGAFETGELYERLAQMSAQAASGASIEAEQQAKARKEDTSIADYVWLPICFEEDGTPYIEWVDEWKHEDYS